ncbi:SLC13 family permease [uncultured Lamprocystis sp.]|jgi:di/tricarboxylate transporter|uniref:SLC13 family permease n=1 Tax=uncultured Lamprocystis sp. TaxID=543132 RepID=UPI0025D92B49|nr:SLC13 family permease [uncultured Lamprocystis sp.]
MHLDLILVLALLGGAILMFSLGRPRADAVALIMLTGLPFTGVISAREAVAGFANPNIILIAAMFVIGEALARTGVAQALGDWLVARGGRRPARLVATLMLIVGALGSVMYSTGVVAIFIPVALRVARAAGLSPAQVLMPVSYAALMSGMLTLVAAAPNLIVNYELTRTGAAGLDFFTLTPIGLPILLLGIGYLLVAGRRLRPAAADGVGAAVRPGLTDWVRDYGLAERELRVRLRPDSPLIGRPLRDLDLQGAEGLTVIAVERVGRLRAATIAPDPDTELAAGDTLLLDSPTLIADADGRCARLGLERLPLSGAYFTDRAQVLGMAEMLLPADSTLIGKTLASLDWAARHGLAAVGLRRGRTAIPAPRRAGEPLRAGDTLLLVGTWAAIGRLRAGGHDLVTLNLPREFDEVLPAQGRAPHAVLVLAITVGLMISGWVPAMHAALIGCLLMGLLGCIDLDSAYRSISLRTLVTIAGMLPFGIALERTGGIDLAAGALVQVLGDAGPHLILATLFAITVVLGLFIVAAANAVLTIPVALALAAELGASPYPFAIIVALAASSAFMTPIAPPNAMVATAGGYRFADYARLGFPLVLLVMVFAVTVVPWLYPLY